MNKKILILGASSDIGQTLTKKLIKKNYKIDFHYNTNFPKQFNKIKKIKKIKLNFKNFDKNDIFKFSSNYDIIINLIGYVNDATYANFKMNDFVNVLKINSIIPLMIIRHSLNSMKKKKFGRIINTSSIGTKFGGSPNTYCYSVSKFINEFIPNEIRQLGKFNVFYNVLNIGVIKTKIHKKISNKNIKKRKKLIPINKLGSTTDVANYIIFLIENNNFIANSKVDITGGE